MRPLPIASTDVVRGYSLRVWEWAAASREAERTVVLLHATGFHARTWDDVVRLLPAAWRVFALDLRGHGASQAPPTREEADWREMAADLREWLERRGLENVVAAGHSMGGCVCTLAAADSARIASLALIDPVLIRPQGPMPPTSPQGLSSGARKRRRVWGSPAEMVARLTGRGAFTHWPQAALERYVRYGLKPTEADGQWELACHPEVEAWCFDWAPVVNPWPEMGRVQQPAIMLRAGGEGHGPPADPAASEAFPDCRQIVVADSDHFIPMRRPDAVAEAIGWAADQI